MNEPTCVKTISATMTLTLPKLSAATMMPHMAAPTRTDNQHFMDRPDILAQKIASFKKPDLRPQLFTHHKDPSNKQKKRTQNMMLGTPRLIKNVIAFVDVVGKSAAQLKTERVEILPGSA